MRKAARAASLIPEAILTADHQQPRYYAPYEAITQVESRAPDAGHISARNMLSRLQIQ